MKLLVLGNGFDIHCELNSKFDDFFSTCLKKENHFLSQKIRSNIWYLLFYFRFYNGLKESIVPKLDNDNPLWMNVEEFISNVVNNNIVGAHGSLLHVIQNVISNKDGGIKNLYEQYYILFDSNQDIIDEITSAVRYKLGNKTNVSLYSYLLDELKNFELDFASFLDSQIKNNKNYRIAANKTVDGILNEHECFIMDFNYTGYLLHYPCLSVHGSLNEHNPIIGIDSKFVQEKNVKRFTKAWRKICIPYGKLQIPRNVDEIIFYGHSLGQQDYSYFHSLFKYYDVYNSEIKLTFLYSDHVFKNSVPDELENTKNKEKYIDAIYDLFGNYVSSVMTKSDADAVTTKIQLENRLLVAELNDYIKAWKSID